MILGSGGATTGPRPTAATSFQIRETEGRVLLQADFGRRSGKRDS